MIDIKLLDKALNYLNEKELIALAYNINPGFTKEESEYLKQVMRRLEKDGYAHHEGKHQYTLTFNGLLALDNAYLFRSRNAPYQIEQWKNRVRNIWLLIKMLAVVLHGLVLLGIAVYTFWNDK